ncbi:holin [Paraburkholderia sp. 32]|uniref:holin n=1 Tax=Paraburkholderia sp. 32 TaxID=2991057 RepID=UPI003D1EAF5D
MQLNEHEKELLTLFGVGAVIGFAKWLLSGERFEVRVVAGRIIIGAGLSMSAGAALTVFPDLPATGLVGIASALGICGQVVLEAVVHKYIGKLPGDRDEGSR